MAEASLELRAILDSAEQAASVQDFASAEHHLRQAASLQEEQLGANHPDLANTLNNLGIVCERTGKSADAEACYRRAYAIATSMLPAEDQLVQTSGQNLRDFCAATGRPFEPEPPAPPAPIPPPESAPAVSSPPVPALSTPPVPAISKAPLPAAPSPPVSMPFTARTPVAQTSSSRGERVDSRRTRSVDVAPSAVKIQAGAASRHHRAIWVVVGSGLLLALVIVLADRLSRSDDSGAPSATSETPPVETAPPREETPPVVASPAPETPVIAKPPKRSTVVKAAETAGVSLVESKLCRSLSNWRCTPATSPAEPGVFIFYTRVKSASDTTVQHQWYLNGSLRRSVELRVGANPGEGYRTYSRNTVAAERQGNWTIELRDAEGALLHEERFLVQ